MIIIFKHGGGATVEAFQALGLPPLAAQLALAPLAPQPQRGDQRAGLEGVPVAHQRGLHPFRVHARLREGLRACLRGA